VRSDWPVDARPGRLIAEPHLRLRPSPVLDAELDRIRVDYNTVGLHAAIGCERLARCHGPLREGGPRPETGLASEDLLFASPANTL
jgi:hypothetical protein